MRMAGALAAGGLVLAVVAATAGVAHLLWSVDPAPAAAAASAPPAEARRAATRRSPRARAPQDAETPARSAVDDAWAAALAAHQAGKPVDALTPIRPFRVERAAWFAEAARAPLVDAMESAAMGLLGRAVRTASLAAVEALAATLRGLVLDPARLAEIDALVEAARRRAEAAAPGVAAEILARALEKKEKAALERHLQRFAGVGATPKKKGWVDLQIESLEKANRTRAADPEPLPLPDPGDAEKRRLDQLEKLRQRAATSLLDHIDGALAWLALHQADDGHFSDAGAAARCKALGHEPACIGSEPKNHAFAATGLAVLAFLDFRDQDVRRLFEPTLARGIAWLVAQQQKDGSFRASGRQGYAAAIGLMALGQAAGSTRSKKLLAVVQKAIGFYAAQAGTDGGYRYRLKQVGDLSVTGWYVQAVEAATNAGALVPDAMTKGLERFLDSVSLGPPAHKFGYMMGRPESASLNAAGMLSSAILRPGSPQWHGDAWREFLLKKPPAATYSLYYGVRILLLLDGKLNPAWRARLDALAKKQRTAGAAAGSIPLLDEHHFARTAGPVAATAFATLTLEHSLYRR